MRIYTTFKEALSEIPRDLKEMGVSVHTTTVQDMDVSQNMKYLSLELQNYDYKVSTPNCGDIPVINLEWCQAEFQERIDPGTPINPGQAWKLRREYWKPFLHEGKFAYTYQESLRHALPLVIWGLKKDPKMRQGFLPIYQFDRDLLKILQDRIPCSIGYWVCIRNGALHLTYLQRSCDFGEHYFNDIWLATAMQHHIAHEVGYPVGTFMHWLGSFHVFEKDVADVF